MQLISVLEHTFYLEATSVLLTYLCLLPLNTASFYLRALDEFATDPKKYRLCESKGWSECS